MAIGLAEVVRDGGSHLSHPSIASSQSTGSGRKYCYLAAAAEATAEAVAHSGCTQYPAIRAWGPAVVFVGTGAVPGTVRRNQDWDDSRQESCIVLCITCCQRAIQERALGSAGRGWAAKGARRESDVRRNRRANVLVPGSTATLTSRGSVYLVYNSKLLQLGRSSGRPDAHTVVCRQCTSIEPSQASRLDPQAQHYYVVTHRQQTSYILTWE